MRLNMRQAAAACSCEVMWIEYFIVSYNGKKRNCMFLNSYQFDKSCSSLLIDQLDHPAVSHWFPIID